MKTIKRRVLLKGIRPIMFDRYSGSNDVTLAPEEKFYLDEAGRIVVPALNISSFLSSQLSESATQRVMGKRWKTLAKAALSFVDIEPFNIPLTRDGKTLTLANSDYKILNHVARVKKTGGLIIPSPKQRPVIATPWELEFTLTLYENKDLSEHDLRTIFEQGGIAIGMGTFRGVFGKFVVEKWEEIE